MFSVKVTLFGEIDPKTGMILNMTLLKKYMEQAIMKPMDHKNLDKDVEYFKSRPSTTENLTIFIWTEMKKVMNKPDQLYEVEVYETENNIVKYRGE
jgi:6-pyruvoyltetrahydropterin/6-carboxytetrahydropterin synthase